jgi:N-acetylglucosamine-6-sulfatase
MTHATAIAAAVLAALLLPPPVPAEAKQRPNVVMVVTDDQALSQYDERTMPRTRRLLGERGTTFTEAIVSTPLCCPSRATMITGQYGHNNGVLRNNYVDLQAKNNTLPVWLDEEGYTTIHVGKYMNRYADAVRPNTEVAPGWDEWHSVTAPHYFRYELQVNGRAKSYGKRPEDYLGRVLTERSVRMVKTYAPKRKPFYLQLDHFAPHDDAGVDPGRCGDGPVPDPVDYDRFAGEPLPAPVSFDEADVSDKPSFIQELPRIDEASRERMQDRHDCALASLASVDRSVAAVHRAVKRAGDLGDTVFIFVSDNGIFAGEHRIPVSKANAYEESLRVPLVISAPAKLLGGEPPRESDLPVANVDIAPTILDLARAEPCRTRRDCRTIDGRSLVPILAGRPGAWPTDRGIVVELDRGKTEVEVDGRACAYTGVRTPTAMFVEHSGSIDPSTRRCQPLDGGIEYELYDLASDPFELQSLAGPGAVPGTPEAALFAEMAARSAELRDCAGIRGRDPEPRGGRTWCE